MERSRILDEFAAVTGYHRKHAIRLLSGWGDRENEKPRVDRLDRRGTRSCRYGSEVRDALIQLWEVSDRVCSKRLQPMIAVLLPALERHRRVTLDEATRAKLLGVSAATIDRLLAGVCQRRGNFGSPAFPVLLGAVTGEDEHIGRTISLTESQLCPSTFCP